MKNLVLKRMKIYIDYIYINVLLIYLYSIMDNLYYLLNKIDVTYELALMLDEFDNSEFEIFDKFMNFLQNNKKHFNVTSNDIELMKYTLKCFFNSDSVEMLDSLLEIEKGDNAYYEEKLKFCNFYLRNPGDNGDKEEIKTIFDNLIKAECYKACYDYGRFLMDEKKIWWG